jgi:hypothetical protein
MAMERGRSISAGEAGESQQQPTHQTATASEFVPCKRGAIDDLQAFASFTTWTKGFVCQQ